MAIIVILCGAPHLYKKDMNNSGIMMCEAPEFGFFAQQNDLNHP